MTKISLGLVVLAGLGIYLWIKGQEVQDDKTATFKEMIQKKYPEIEFHSIPGVTEEEYAGWMDYDPYDVGEPY